MDREQRKELRKRGAATRQLSQSYVSAFIIPSPKLRSSKSHRPSKNEARSPIVHTRTEEERKAKYSPVNIRGRPIPFLQATPVKQTTANPVTPFTLNDEERQELEALDMDFDMDFQEDTDRVPVPDPFSNDDHNEDILDQGNITIRDQRKRIRREEIPPVTKPKSKKDTIRKETITKHKSTKTTSAEKLKALKKKKKKKKWEFKLEHPTDDERRGTLIQKRTTRSTRKDYKEPSEDEYAPDNDFGYDVVSDNSSVLHESDEAEVIESDQSDVDDILYSNRGDNTIKISRVPISGSRLTFIDLLIHYFEQEVPRYKDFDKDPEVFKKFLKTTVFELEKVLDLNLSNNHYLMELRGFKQEKNEIRREILDVTSRANELNSKITKLRSDYRVLKQNIGSFKDIDLDIESMKDDDSDENDKNDELVKNDRLTGDFLLNVNYLSSIINPDYGLLEKLKKMNKKLYTIDKLVNKK